MPKNNKQKGRHGTKNKNKDKKGGGNHALFKEAELQEQEDFIHGLWEQNQIRMFSEIFREAGISKEAAEQQAAHCVKGVVVEESSSSSSVSKTLDTPKSSRSADPNKALAALLSKQGPQSFQQVGNQARFTMPDGSKSPWVTNPSYTRDSSVSGIDATMDGAAIDGVKKVLRNCPQVTLITVLFGMIDMFEMAYLGDYTILDENGSRVTRLHYADTDQVLWEELTQQQREQHRNYYENRPWCDKAVWDALAFQERLQCVRDFDRR
jgi:hypothetical protein